MQAYAGYLSRNGGKDETIMTFAEFDKQLPRYPLVVEAMAVLRKDEQLPRMVASGQSGAAGRDFTSPPPALPDRSDHKGSR
jgi:hypothetical protein